MLWKLILSCIALFTHSHDLHRGDENSVESYEFTPTADGPQTLEEAEIAHQALHGKNYGGDMVFSPDFNISDAGIKNPRFRWPNVGGKITIPYFIDGSLGHARNLILRGMKQYHDQTCIKFVERTNQRDFIRIFNGNGCWSMIGRVGGRQDLSLGRGCLYVGLVVHELGHAVGLFHEHQRSDRDNFINVYLNNVIQGQQHNFVRTNPNDELIFTPYDYQSIMHYGEYAFSLQPNQRRTMQAKRSGVRLVEPYDKPGFTSNDIVTIKKLYQCS